MVHHYSSHHTMISVTISLPLFCFVHPSRNFLGFVSSVRLLGGVGRVKIQAYPTWRSALESSLSLGHWLWSLWYQSMAFFVCRCCSWWIFFVAFLSAGAYFIRYWGREVLPYASFNVTPKFGPCLTHLLIGLNKCSPNYGSFDKCNKHLEQRKIRKYDALSLPIPPPPPLRKLFRL